MSIWLIRYDRLFAELEELRKRYPENSRRVQEMRKKLDECFHRLTNKDMKRVVEDLKKMYPD